MIYQKQTNQVWGGKPKPAQGSARGAWQVWDAAIRHFALAGGAVSYLGKQGCCFLAGNLLQGQKRLSVVGLCVILDITSWWPRARCTVAGITSSFCRSGFSVWFSLYTFFYPQKSDKEAYCLHQQ